MTDHTIAPATILEFKRGAADAPTEFTADTWAIAAQVARHRGHERLADACEARARIGVMPLPGPIHVAASWVCTAR